MRVYNCLPEGELLATLLTKEWFFTRVTSQVIFHALLFSKILPAAFTGVRFLTGVPANVREEGGFRLQKKKV